MKYIKIFLVIFIVLGFQDTFSQIKTYGKIYPFDDSKDDPSFTAFLTELKTALNNKDKKFIYNILDPKIEFDFGLKPGKKGFWKFWKLDDESSKFWDTFSEVINLGFVKGGNEGYCFPYYWGNEKLEGFECNAIIAIKENVKVYSSPDRNSEVLDSLSYDIVLGDYETFGDDEIWYEIKINRNLKGYISDLDAKEICGYRGGFIFENNKWILNWFLAGD